MHTGRGEGLYWRDSAQSTSCLHGAAAQTANRGQEGGGAGYAGRGRNAARWLSSLRALLLCWLPAALLHWRHAQRALASELSSGMPDDHDTALHSTRVQPIRPINLARAGADGPEPRRQVHLHCDFERAPAIVLWLTGGNTFCAPAPRPAARAGARTLYIYSKRRAPRGAPRTFILIQRENTTACVCYVYLERTLKCKKGSALRGTAASPHATLETHAPDACTLLQLAHTALTYTAPFGTARSRRRPVQMRGRACEHARE